MAKVKLLRRQNRSAAAYTLVDLSDLHPELRKDIIEDANEGAGTYGIRVVEESVNGGARAPIYGYYKDGPDAERWTNAKKELGLDGTEVTDDEVYSSVDVVDDDREALLREQARERADTEADALRRAEDRDVRAITGEDDDDDDEDTVERVPPLSHHANRIDETLAEDATNEAADAKNRTTKESETGSDAKGGKPAKSKTKTPR